MTLRIQDHTKWTGRAKLHGVKRRIGPIGEKEVIEYSEGPNIGKWGWDSSRNPLVSRMESDVYQASCKASDALRAKKQELQATNLYTPEGIRQELKKFYETSVVPTFIKSKTAIESARQEIADRRSKMKPDFGTNGVKDPTREHLKSEARTVLRGMSHREVVATLAGADADPIFLEAVLESHPSFIKNVPASLRSHLKQNVIEAKFGPQIEELNELDRVVAEATEVAMRVEKDVQQELGREPAAPPKLRAV